MTNEELAGLLMEQEHDICECDSDSEHPAGAQCVQVLPKGES